MNIVEQFVIDNQLKPGYVLRAKGFDGILDHWFIYLGQHYLQDEYGLQFQHVFGAAIMPAQRFLGEKVLENLMQKYKVVEIRRCYVGNDCDPAQIAKRAIEKLLNNKEQFHPLYNNCQSFTSYVSIGRKESYQANQLGAVLLLFLMLLLLLYTIRK